nr:hypothetical protein [Tanacetum cinerariifolium]
FKLSLKKKGELDSINGTIDEEVYVMQPPGLYDPQFPAKVYKVEKAMYGLHQAPRAWNIGDFLLVQVYVDDIIFGSSNPLLCREFEALVHEKFQMSAMGELNFFLGLQVTQKEDGIFLSQDKYVGDILKNFGYTDVRHQVTPKECHLYAVKRIFRYLKGHPKLGLWYPKESPFDLVAYSNSDYGGAAQDRKSTTRGCQFLGRRLNHGNARSRRLWPLSQLRQNMLQLLLAVDKFCGFRISCWIMGTTL